MNSSKYIFALIIILFFLPSEPYVYLDNQNIENNYNFSLLEDVGFGISTQGLIHDDDYIYLMFDHYIIKTNINALNNLNSAGHYIYLNETPDTFVVDNNIMITSLNNFLRIYDVTEIENSELYYSFIEPINFTSMLFENNFLFISKGADGLSIYDISNPYAPDNIYNYSPLDSCYYTKMVLKDTILMINDKNSIVRFNVSDINHVKLIDEIKPSEFINTTSIVFDVHNTTLYAAKQDGGVYHMFSLEDTTFPNILSAQALRSIHDLYISEDNLYLIDSTKKYFTCYHATDDSSITRYFDYNSGTKNNYYFSVGDFLYRLFPSWKKSCLEKADFTNYSGGVTVYSWHYFFNCESDIDKISRVFIVSEPYYTLSYKPDGTNFIIDTICNTSVDAVPFDSFFLDIDQGYDSTFINKYYYVFDFWMDRIYDTLPYTDAVFESFDSILVSYCYDYGEPRMLRTYFVDSDLIPRDSCLIADSMNDLNRIKYNYADSCLYCYSEYNSGDNIKIKINDEGSLLDISKMNISTSDLCFNENHAFSALLFDDWIVVYDMTLGDSFTPVDSYYVNDDFKSIECYGNSLYLNSTFGIYRLNVDDVHNPQLEAYLDQRARYERNFFASDSFLFVSEFSKRRIYQYTGPTGIVDNNISDKFISVDNMFCNGQIHLKDFPCDKAAYFSIYDIKGSKVMHGTINGLSPIIDISNCTNGAYFLHLGNNKYCIKITLIK